LRIRDALLGTASLFNCTRFAGGRVTHERHGFVFDDHCPYISTKTYPMTGTPHDARPSLFILEGPDAVGILCCFLGKRLCWNCLTLIFLAVSRFVDEQTFDRVVDPAKMVKPYAVVAAWAEEGLYSASVRASGEAQAAEIRWKRTSLRMADAIDHGERAPDRGAAARWVAEAANAARAAGPPLLFGLRLWASVCLALYVAFWLELDNAFWSGTTAAIVCQPHLGASLRKGWFRMIGTVVGAVAIVVLTACFPQERAA
jgi:hypothetical protein